MTKKEKFGWLISFLLSQIFPKLTSPFALTPTFDVGAATSGMLGFGGMLWFLRKRNVNGRKKLGVALLALVIGVGTFYLYNLLLVDPANVSPNHWIELLELVVYCISYLSLFVAWGYAFWHWPEGFRIFGKK
jgi:hypothetical protein